MAIYGEGTAFELIRCDTEADWLALRGLGVGGSDVAAIMGLSRWKTAAQVWMEKTHKVEAEDISDKPYVRFGVLMEPEVGRWYAETHPDRRVRRVNAVLRSKGRPWAQASLDYEVRDKELGWGVLEIKTAGNAKDWEDGVPPYYLTQITHYMSVTGRAFADVAVFFRDTCTFADYRVMRDEEDIELVNDAVDTFWHDNVEADVMPALTGTGGEVTALTAMFGTGSDYRFDDSDTIKEAIAAYKDAAERERQAKGDKEKASATLAALVGDAKGIEYSGGRVTWVRTNRTSFDSKRFKAEHPDLWAEYAQSRTCNGGFRIKESA